jgi:hypothetical protein
VGDSSDWLVMSADRGLLCHYYRETKKAKKNKKDEEYFSFLLLFALCVYLWLFTAMPDFNIAYRHLL